MPSSAGPRTRSWPRSSRRRRSRYVVAASVGWPADLRYTVRCDPQVDWLPLSLEELLAFWPPEAPVAVAWMAGVSVDNRGTVARMAHSAINVFSVFMADAKCRAMVVSGDLTPEEARAARADGRFLAKRQAPHVYRGQGQLLARRNPLQKRDIITKNDLWKVRCNGWRCFLGPAP